MNLDTLREGLADCPSNLALEELVTEDLSADRAREVRAHVSTCDRCRDRVAQRRGGFEAFPEVDAAALLAGIKEKDVAPVLHPPRPWGRAKVWAPVLLAVAAAVLLFVMPQSPAPVGPPEIGDTVRVKGALGLHVHRARGDHAEVVTGRDRFRPGDRLRFVVDLPADGYVQVVGVEASGRLYSAWPRTGPGQARSAGRGLALPGAVELDDAPGRETLHLVWCPSAPPQCRTKGTARPPACQADCLSTAFVLEKAP